MGQPLTETYIDIHEKLEELSRQMEEVNGSVKEEQISLDKDGAADEELDLNVEAPVDTASMEVLSETEDDPGSGVADLSQPVSSRKDMESTTEKASETDPNPTSAQDENEDEIGINIEDDELWDEGEAEEIPLFEEELLSEISEEEEQEQQDQQDKNKVEGEERATDDSSLEAQESKEVQDESDLDQGQEQSIPSSEQHDEANEKEPDPSLFSALLPWLITGLSSILTILAIVTIWFLWHSSPMTERQVIASHDVIKPKASSRDDIQQAHSQQSPRVTVSQQEAIDLAPFIIPGKSDGELVFFKLQVELVVPDATTKQELLRRQAWLRDIIYQELKGLDISRGVQGDILSRYRGPLLSRLNREFSPLKIEDIRLMGYLLR